MKNLFKLGLASLLLSVFVLSGCHKDMKDDIDDLKERVTTIEGTLKTLNESVDGLKLVSNISVVGNVLKIQWSDGSSTDIQGVVNEAFPDPEVVDIVAGYTVNKYYVQIVINDNSSKTGTTTFRFPTEAGAAPSSVVLLTQEAKAEVGKTAYAIFRVNPSTFVPTVDNVTLVGAFSRSIEVGQHEFPVSVTKVVSLAAAVADDATVAADPGLATYTPQEGDYVAYFEFEGLIGALKDIPLNIAVKTPSPLTQILGAWQDATNLPTDETLKMGTIASTNSFKFGDEQILFTGNLALAITPDPVPGINSDGNTSVEVLLQKSGVSPAEAWAGDPASIDMDATMIEVTSVDVAGTVYTKGANDADLAKYAALLDFKAQAKDWTAPTTEGAWKTIAIDTKPNAAWIDASLPIAIANGNVVTYTFTVTAAPVDAGAGTVDNVVTTFTLAVTKVTNEATLTETPLYIPTAATKEVAKHEISTAAGNLYAALTTTMGFTQAQAQAARLNGTPVLEVYNNTTAAWEASTEPITVAEDTNGDLTVSTTNAVNAGKYRLTYKYTIANRNVVVYDEITVNAPTLTVKLAANVAEYGSVTGVIGGTGPVDAAKVYLDLPTDAVDLAKVIDVVNIVTVGDTEGVYEWEDGLVVDNPINATPATVSAPATVADFGKAQKVEVFATLKTGQKIPVTVAQSGATGPSSWTAGEMYVVAQPNQLTLTENSSEVPATINFFDIKTTPVDAGAFIQQGTFSGVDKQKTAAEQLPLTISATAAGNNNPAYNAYENILKDPRFLIGGTNVGTITFTPGKATIGGAETDAVITVTVTEEEVTNPDYAEADPAKGPEKYMKRVANISAVAGAISWTGNATQPLVITAKDAFGGETSITINLTIKGEN